MRRNDFSLTSETPCPVPSDLRKRQAQESLPYSRILPLFPHEHRSIGYARRENVHTAIQRAIETLKTTDYEPEPHFRGVTKMVTRWKGGPEEKFAQKTISFEKLPRGDSEENPDLARLTLEAIG